MNAYNAAIWAATTKNRLRLADYLESLSPGDWNTPSLCRGWLVRDVVAHLILETRYSAFTSLPEFIASGLSFNRFFYKTAKKYGDNPSSQLIADLRAASGRQLSPPFGSPRNVYIDLLVHEQDIRIPLNAKSELLPDELLLVFSDWKPGDTLGEKLVGVQEISQGLSWVADDIDWQTGHGPLVLGRAQDIMMSLAGRRTALNSLRGDGVPILTRKLADR